MDMHQTNNEPEQQWRDRRRECTLPTDYSHCYREYGSGWILVGTLVLLVPAAVALLAELRSRAAPGSFWSGFTGGSA